MLAMLTTPVPRVRISIWRTRSLGAPSGRSRNTTGSTPLPLRSALLLTAPSRLMSIEPPPGWRSASISIESNGTGVSDANVSTSPDAVATALKPDSQNSAILSERWIE